MKNCIPLSIQVREFVFSLIRRFLKLRPRPVIFCFHSVDENSWLFSVTPQKFEMFVNQITKMSKVIDLGSLFNKSRETNNNEIAITFDDGYEDVFTNAYPLLKKQGAAACVFISGTPDDKGDFGYLDGRKLLNINQIRILKREGWEIGYHSKTHPDLRKLTEKQLNGEIVRSKSEVEKNLDFKLDYFAYPHGLFNQSTLDIVNKAGYKYAFTADGGGVRIEGSPYKLGRVLLDRYSKADDLRVLTSCQGLFFNKLFTLLLRVKDDLL